MPQLLIATENLGKLKEFQEIFGDSVTCLATSDPKLARKQPVHVVEDGETYFENALKKALAYHRGFRAPVLADDSGIEVDVLGGAPGVFSARFGGEEIPWPDRWKLLLSKMAPFSKEAWTARFRCVLCFYDGQGVPVFFEGTTEGIIQEQAKGKHGFGYDPLFYSPTLKKTFAEATPTEKHRLSHRAVACREFLQWFRSTQA